MVSGLLKIISIIALTGWNCFQRLHINVQAEESEFQTSVPWANVIKMKTHFQFISMNWKHYFIENGQKQGN